MVTRQRHHDFAARSASAQNVLPEPSLHFITQAEKENFQTGKEA
jgi:hypothetical protein